MRYFWKERKMNPKVNEKVDEPKKDPDPVEVLQLKVVALERENKKITDIVSKNRRDLLDLTAIETIRIGFVWSARDRDRYNYSTYISQDEVIGDLDVYLNKNLGNYVKLTLVTQVYSYGTYEPHVETVYEIKKLSDSEYLLKTSTSKPQTCEVHATFKDLAFRLLEPAKCEDHYNRYSHLYKVHKMYLLKEIS